jgi:hypothetical protein
MAVGVDERPAKRGVDAEQRKEVGRCAAHGHLHRFTAAGQVKVVIGPRGDVEGAGPVAQQLVAHQRARLPVRMQRDAYQLLRLCVWKRPQQQRAGHRKDRGVGADGER